ncbi:hypothetical protein BGZ76_003244 [Entomortierella beljakovae]|nr:hypothetical protein BGZ76_003244 [Entomortierella beljakovae]
MILYDANAQIFANLRNPKFRTKAIAMTIESTSPSQRIQFPYILMVELLGIIVKINSGCQRVLFQVTYNPTHSIAHDKFVELLEVLKKQKWMKSADQVQYVIIAPIDCVPKFKKQNFKTGQKIHPDPSSEVLKVKQYIVGFDLGKALAGKNPFEEAEETASKIPDRKDYVMSWRNDAVLQPYVVAQE